MFLNLPVSTTDDSGAIWPTHPRGSRSPVNVWSCSAFSLPHLSDQPKQDCRTNLTVRENYALRLFAKIRRKQRNFTGNSAIDRPTLAGHAAHAPVCTFFITPPLNVLAQALGPRGTSHVRCRPGQQAAKSRRADTLCRWLSHRCPVTITNNSCDPRRRHPAGSTGDRLLNLMLHL